MINIPQELIERKGYLERIKPFIRKDIAKVLIGQRRVGKSYLLFQLMKHLLDENPNAHIIYINMEDISFSHIRTAENLYMHITSQLQSDGYNYIFIDEVQEVPQFERAIRTLLLSQRNDIYLSGSNAKMLSGELATYLSGRYVSFNVYSLSYLEFLEFHHLENNDTSLALYTRYGGMPYLTHLSLTEEIANEYLGSVYSTIVFRDVVGRYNLRNSDFLERFIHFLAENIGNLFSAKNISDYLKSQHTSISVSQIQNYAQYLSNAFLIHRVERYDLVGKRVFEIGEKFYFEDLGIRNTIIGYRHTDQAKMIENLVYNHLLYRGYHVRIGYIGNQEIDFVAELNHERIYIQVALHLDSEEIRQREFGNLLKIQDNYPKYVITPNALSGNTYEGIQIYPLRKFLSNF